jgi:hypothetical protein
MQCKELEAVLEQEGLSPLPLDAREHLAGCASCQDFLADLSAVVVAAKRIPAEVVPPDRIWISLRAQLEAEGIILDQEPELAAKVSPWWQSFSQFFRPRALATVGVGLFLVLGSIYLWKRPHVTNIAKVPPPVQAQVGGETSKTVAPPPVPPKLVAPLKSPVQPAQLARNRQQPQPHESHHDLLPSPSENASLVDSAAVLSATEGDLPSRELTNNAAVDASLRQNLRTLNEFIAECEARLKQNPRDQLTREYLNMAYQQKAELLTAMMDSGRSEH